MSYRILIIEDEETLRESLKRVLLKEGYEVSAAESAEAGQLLMGREGYDVVVTDIILPGVSGMEYLKACRQKSPELIVIIMTAYATIESAVEAIRAGAYEYIVKPVQHEEFKAIIKKALSGKAVRRG